MFAMAASGNSNKATAHAGGAARRAKKAAPSSVSKKKKTQPAGALKSTKAGKKLGAVHTFGDADVSRLNAMSADVFGKRHAAGLVHMQGCPFCVQMRPAWDGAAKKMAACSLPVLEIEAGAMYPGANALTDVVRRSPAYQNRVPFVFVYSPDKGVVAFGGEASRASSMDFFKFVHSVVA